MHPIFSLSAAPPDWAFRWIFSICWRTSYQSLMQTSQFTFLLAFCNEMYVFSSKTSLPKVAFLLGYEVEQRQPTGAKSKRIASNQHQTSSFYRFLMGIGGEHNFSNSYWAPNAIGKAAIERCQLSRRFLLRYQRKVNRPDVVFLLVMQY